AARQVGHAHGTAGPQRREDAHRRPGDVDPRAFGAVTRGFAALADPGDAGEGLLDPPQVVPPGHAGKPTLHQVKEKGGHEVDGPEPVDMQRSTRDLERTRVLLEAWLAERLPPGSEPAIS